MVTMACVAMDSQALVNAFAMLVLQETTVQHVTQAITVRLVITVSLTAVTTVPVQTDSLALVCAFAPLAIPAIPVTPARTDITERPALSAAHAALVCATMV